MRKHWRCGKERRPRSRRQALPDSDLHRTLTNLLHETYLSKRKEEKRRDREKGGGPM